MDDQWYYAKGSLQHGPLTRDALVTLKRAGEVGPDDKVWSAGMADWLPSSSIWKLGEVPGLPPVISIPGSEMSNPILAGATAAIAPPPYYGTSNFSQQPSQFVFASFWVRVAAYFIDGIILGIGFLFVLLLLGFFFPGKGMGQSDAAMARATFNLFCLIAAWLYNAFMESTSGSTLGKSIMGIQVTDLEGRKISFARASGRYFGKYISSLILCIGFMMVAWTPDNQGLHDLMAGTVVIQSPV